MNERKDRIQGATLALCAALLGVTLWQGAQIRGLLERMENTQNGIMNNLDNLGDRVSGLASRMAESERLVRDWTLETVGADRETRSILTEVSLTLKEWREDTQVWLTARQGSEVWKVALEHDGAGRFSGGLGVSPEGKDDLLLEACVESGGTTRQEELGGWEASLLLPVQNSGSGYGGPTYQDGAFALDGYTVYLCDFHRKSTTVEEAEFSLSRDGEIVWQGDGVYEGDGAYATGGTVRTDCRPGDTVELRFTCRDQYGLKYAFAQEGWRMEEDGQIVVTAPDSRPVLSWD